MSKGVIFMRETALIEEIGDYIRAPDSKKKAIFENSLSLSIFQFTHLCIAEKDWNICPPLAPRFGWSRAHHLLVSAGGVCYTREFLNTSVIEVIISNHGNQIVLAAGWLIMIGKLHTHKRYYETSERGSMYSRYLMKLTRQILETTAKGVRTHFPEPPKTLDQLEEGEWGNPNWYTKN